jgi:hypothetical protein
MFNVCRERRSGEVTHLFTYLGTSEVSATAMLAEYGMEDDAGYLFERVLPHAEMFHVYLCSEQGEEQIGQVFATTAAQAQDEAQRVYGASHGRFGDLTVC